MVQIWSAQIVECYAMQPLNICRSWIIALWMHNSSSNDQVLIFESGFSPNANLACFKSKNYVMPAFIFLNFCVAKSRLMFHQYLLGSLACDVEHILEYWMKFGKGKWYTFLKIKSSNKFLWIFIFIFIFLFLLNFKWFKLLKIQYLLHLRSKN